MAQRPATLITALGLVDEVHRELSIYKACAYEASLEEQALNRALCLVLQIKAGIQYKDQEGVFRSHDLSLGDWDKIVGLVVPLATCFREVPVSQPTPAALYASAGALAVLAGLSGSSPDAKVLLSRALEAGVVEAFVRRLRQGLNNPDSVVKAMLYSIVRTLMSLTYWANAEQLALLVSRGVVDACLELLAAKGSERETKSAASKALRNCLVSAPGRVVEALLPGTVTALNGLLQQLAAQVPSPATVAQMAAAPATGGATPRVLSLPESLQYVMSWVWFLPSGAMDAVFDALELLLGRVVVLVWPEGCTGIQTVSVESTGAAPEAAPLSIAQHAMRSRSLRPTLKSLLSALTNKGNRADPRLARILRGVNIVSPAAPNSQAAATASAAGIAGGTSDTSNPAAPPASTGAAATAGKRAQAVRRKPSGGKATSAGSGEKGVAGTSTALTGAAGAPTTATAAPSAAPATAATASTDLSDCGLALPARLVRLLASGRPDGVEVRAALELLGDLLDCDAGGHPELGKDAIEAGLLDAMARLDVLQAMSSADGLAGLSAYMRITIKLAHWTPQAPGLATRLCESGVAASVATILLMSGAKVNLKLESLQALLKLMALDEAVVEAVLVSPGFVNALSNTLLGGDPDSGQAFPKRKPAKKAHVARKGSSSAQRASGATCLEATNPACDAGGELGAAAAGSEAVAQAPRDFREEAQVAALDILRTIVKAAGDSGKVRQLLAQSNMLPRLLRYCQKFSMPHKLLADMVSSLQSVLTACAEACGGDDGESDPWAASVLAVMQATCTPHVLPLLVHADPWVELQAARLLVFLLGGMEGYQQSPSSTQLRQLWDGVLAALVAVAPIVDDAELMAARLKELATASSSAAAAASAAAASTGPGSAGSQGGPGADTGAAGAPGGPQLVDVTQHGVGRICAAIECCLACIPAVPEPPPSPPPHRMQPLQQQTDSNKEAGDAAVALTALGLDPLLAAKLESLLLCVAILAEAGLQSPVRKHLARALAYAKPAVDQLAAKLGAPAEALREQRSCDAATALQELLARVRAALGALPIVDVSLLPKPAPAEAPVAIGARGTASMRVVTINSTDKGRTTTGGKRKLQKDKAAAGSDAKEQRSGKQLRRAAAPAEQASHANTASRPAPPEAPKSTRAGAMDADEVSGGATQEGGLINTCSLTAAASRASPAGGCTGGRPLPLGSQQPSAKRQCVSSAGANLQALNTLLSTIAAARNARSSGAAQAGGDALGATSASGQCVQPPGAEEPLPAVHRNAATGRAAEVRPSAVQPAPAGGAAAEGRAAAGGGEATAPGKGRPSGEGSESAALGNSSGPAAGPGVTEAASQQPTAGHSDAHAARGGTGGAGGGAAAAGIGVHGCSPSRPLSAAAGDAHDAGSGGALRPPHSGTGPAPSPAAAGISSGTLPPLTSAPSIPLAAMAADTQAAPGALAITTLQTAGAGATSASPTAVGAPSSGRNSSTGSLAVAQTVRAGFLAVQKRNTELLAELQAQTKLAEERDTLLRETAARLNDALRAAQELREDKEAKEKEVQGLRAAKEAEAEEMRTAKEAMNAEIEDLRKANTAKDALVGQLQEQMAAMKAHLAAACGRSTRRRAHPIGSQCAPPPRLAAMDSVRCSLARIDSGSR